MAPQVGEESRAVRQVQGDNDACNIQSEPEAMTQIPSLDEAERIPGAE